MLVSHLQIRINSYCSSVDYQSCLQDPKTYVSALLEVHRKYSAMVSLSFGDDAGFMQALDKVKVY